MTSKKRLRKELRWELELHWDALANARRMAITPGSWTIGCENHADAIRRLSKLVGPTRWESVPITLLEDGTYQRLTAELGFAGPEFEPDMNHVRDLVRRTDGSTHHIRGVAP
jgi:hypothetical protein